MGHNRDVESATNMLVGEAIAHVIKRGDTIAMTSLTRYLFPENSPEIHLQHSLHYFSTCHETSPSPALVLPHTNHATIIYFRAARTGMESCRGPFALILRRLMQSNHLQELDTDDQSFVLLL